MEAVALPVLDGIPGEYDALVHDISGVVPTLSIHWDVWRFIFGETVELPIEALHESTPSTWWPLIQPFCSKLYTPWSYHPNPTTIRERLSADHPRLYQVLQTAGAAVDKLGYLPSVAAIVQLEIEPNTFVRLESVDDHIGLMCAAEPAELVYRSLWLATLALTRRPASSAYASVLLATAALAYDALAVRVLARIATQTRLPAVIRGTSSGAIPIPLASCISLPASLQQLEGQPTTIIRIPGDAAQRMQPLTLTVDQNIWVVFVISQSPTALTLWHASSVGDSIRITTVPYQQEPGNSLAVTLPARCNLYPGYPVDSDGETVDLITDKYIDCRFRLTQRITLQVHQTTVLPEPTRTAVSIMNLYILVWDYLQLPAKPPLSEYLQAISNPDRRLVYQLNFWRAQILLSAWLESRTSILWGTWLDDKANFPILTPSLYLPGEHAGSLPEIAAEQGPETIHNMLSLYTPAESRSIQVFEPGNIMAVLTHSRALVFCRSFAHYLVIVTNLGDGFAVVLAATWLEQDAEKVCERIRPRLRAGILPFALRRTVDMEFIVSPRPVPLPIMVLNLQKTSGWEEALQSILEQF